METHMIGEDNPELDHQAVDPTGRSIATGRAVRAMYNDESAGKWVELPFTLPVTSDPFRIFVESMAEGALTLSQEGRVLSCNPALAHVLGRPLREVLGGHFAGWVSADYQDAYAALLASAAERCRGDLRLVRADGATVSVELITRRLHRPDIAVVICVIVSDRTEQERRHALETEQQVARVREQRLLERRQESDRRNFELLNTNRQLNDLCAELQEKARRLTDAEAVKTRLLLNLNHEVRSPLNSIFALTSLLLCGAEGELNAEQVKLVGYIRKAADSLLDLVNDSLDVARREAGDLEVHAAPFEVAESFDTLRGLLPESLVHPGVRLIFDEPRGIPTLCSDESKVLQTLRNLINNALKFTEQGEVRVSAGYDHATDIIYCAVRDTGIGIAPEEQEKILNQRARLDSSPESRAQGSGLGLPLCLRLAARLRGRIMLESAPGAGSTFVLALPRRFASEAEETAGRGTALTESRIDLRWQGGLE